MKLLNKILVPIDINIETETLAEKVNSIASEFDSSVLLICTLPKEMRHKSFADSLKKIANEKLNNFEKKLNGVEVSLKSIDFANPLENIIMHSRVENVNVIITAPLLHGDKDDKIISSLVQKLVRKSEKPVWVAKESQNHKIKTILCPTDFSDASERALKNTLQIVKKFHSKVIILNTYLPYFITSLRIEIDLEKENQNLKAQHEQEMEVFLKKFSLTDVNFSVMIKDGDTNQVINNIVLNNNVDLVVAGTTGKNNFGKIIIGSVTEKLIREMPCSVITTKASDIVNLKLENETNDIELLSKLAQEELDCGNYEKAIVHYKMCLRINDMHIPSHFRIAKAYKTLGDMEKYETYKQNASELLSKIWDKDMESEIRKHYLD